MIFHEIIRVISFVIRNKLPTLRTSQIPHTPILHATHNYINFNIHSVKTNYFAINAFDTFTHNSHSFKRSLTDFGTLRALPNQSDQYQYLYASGVSHGRTCLLCTMAYSKYNRKNKQSLECIDIENDGVATLLTHLVVDNTFELKYHYCSHVCKQEI